jgi:hypothetical protein
VILLAPATAPLSTAWGTTRNQRPTAITSPPGRPTGGSLAAWRVIPGGAEWTRQRRSRLWRRCELFYELGGFGGAARRRRRANPPTADQVDRDVSADAVD